MQDVVIVIPVYRKAQALRWFERLSLRRCFDVFGGVFPIVFLAPEGFAIDYGAPYDDMPCERFASAYFTGIDGYNALMMAPAFYERFRAFRKLLIYQLDAFVLADDPRELDRFVAMDYDWIGAPWYLDLRCCPPRAPRFRNAGEHTYAVVGNGGFCLRDVQACLRFLAKYGAQPVSEDHYFCSRMRRDPAFRIAPLRVACAFASELDAERTWQKNGYQLPLGCHGWHKFSADFYVWAFGTRGIDLRPHRAEMFDADLIWLAYFLRRWRDREEEHPRSDLPRAAYAEELRTALAREDVYAAGEAICFAEQHLLPPGDADTAVLVQHVDALLYHGIQDLQDGRPGAAIAYLKAWQRITYKFGGQTWPELYDYLAAAYRAKGMERMAAHVAALRP